MSDYCDYKIAIRLLAPLGTPMQSDTLFGHLAWQVQYEKGDGGTAAFLEPFLADKPPFVLSDAFPSGLFPRPLLPEPMPSGTVSRTDYARLKRDRKNPFVRVSDFAKMVRGQKPDMPPVPSPWKPTVMLHAAIDRNTWTTSGEGNLFETEGIYLEEPSKQDTETSKWAGQRLDIYVRVKPEAVKELERLFRLLAKSGFGKDKSIGAGEFEVSGFEETSVLAAPPQADGFVSLSTYMPSEADPVDGRWRVRIKRGFIGEVVPKGEGGNPNPFKRPMIQLEPGAVFKVEKKTQPVYGRMVRDIAPGFPQAVQCGYCIAAACLWSDKK